MKPPLAKEEEADESLVEMRHLLRSPANAARLLQSIAETEKGLLIDREMLEPGASLGKLEN